MLGMEIGVGSLEVFKIAQTMKVIWSGIGITDGRGKIGGQVLSRNRAGAFARTYVVGTNPSTAAQVAVRARYSQALGDWATLTTAQQDAWISAAASGDWDVYDSLGQRVSLSGQQVFVQVNLAVDASLQPVTTVPALPSLTPLNIDDYEVRATAGVLSHVLINHTETVIPTGTECIFWLTAGMSPGVRSPRQSAFKQLVRMSKATFDAAAGQLNLYVQYESRFALPLEGQRVYLSSEICDTASGRRIEYYRDGTIVTYVP